MFITWNNTLVNADNISYMMAKNKTILFALQSRNYLIEYGSEDLAKKALSKVRVAIAKGSSIVDISESKIQEVI
jgi:hypothetical protein